MPGRAGRCRGKMILVARNLESVTLRQLAEQFSCSIEKSGRPKSGPNPGCGPAWKNMTGIYNEKAAVMHSVEMKDAIRIWQDYTGSMTTGHLDEAALYRMALPGGLTHAPRADIDHLAGCPACLEKWELLTRVMTDSQESGLKPLEANLQNPIPSWPVMGFYRPQPQRFPNPCF